MTAERHKASVPDSDNPIVSAAQDRLNRTATARALANEYRVLDASEGAVTALMGPWGSGKTSLVNLVREKLTEDPPLVVLDFNPWLFTGADALVSSFFRELSAQLRDKSKRNYGKLADQLADYGDLLGPLVWLPVVGAWAARLKTLAGAVRDRKKASVYEVKARITASLRQLESPIVVVVDDIDRLSSNEIQDIFRLVRLTANFPNVIYLLVFDRARVEAALETDGLPGRSYLEKIVQSGYDLPAVPEGVLWTQVAEALQSVSDSLPEGDEHFDANRWPDLMSELIMPQIRNMRDVRRYVASSRPTMAALKSDMDLGDLLVLEAFRVFQPDIFSALTWRVEALTTPASWGGASYRDTALREQMGDLVSLAGKREQLVRDLVARVFPAGLRHLGNNSYGSDWQKSWLKARLAAHPHILHLYFERVAPSGLSAFNDGEKAFGLLADPVGFNAFMTQIEPARLQDVIAAIETFEGDYPTDQLPEVMAHLLGMKQSLPERKRSFYDLMDAGLIVDRVVLRMLRQYPHQGELEAATLQAWEHLTSLSDQIDLLRLIERGKHESDAGLASDEFIAHRRDDLVAAIRARDWSALASERRLISLLLATEEWGVGLRQPSPDAGPELQLAVLSGCKGTIRSQAMGNRHVEETATLNWDTLTKLYGSEDAVRAARDVVVAQYGDSQADLIALVDRYLAGYRHRDFDTFDGEGE